VARRKVSCGANAEHPRAVTYLEWVFDPFSFNDLQRF